MVTLHVTSDHADGALFVYLEDVDPEGQSRYVTEGGLRLLHRRCTENPDFVQATPYHSFAKADAAPMVPGESAEIRFELWPTSARIAAGHRLRLAIAGADADTFDPVPAEGKPTLEVAWGPARPSRLELPVIDTAAAAEAAATPTRSGDRRRR